MNIEKLAKHLKEFTLDEIEMIVEFDCKPELEQLLNEDKIIFEQGLYKYIEKSQIVDFGIFVSADNKQELRFEEAVHIFIEDYAKNIVEKELMKHMNQYLK